MHGVHFVLMGRGEDEWETKNNWRTWDGPLHTIIEELGMMRENGRQLTAVSVAVYLMLWELYKHNYENLVVGRWPTSIGRCGVEWSWGRCIWEGRSEQVGENGRRLTRGSLKSCICTWGERLGDGARKRNTDCRRRGSIGAATLLLKSNIGLVCGLAAWNASLLLRLPCQCSSRTVLSSSSFASITKWNFFLF